MNRNVLALVSAAASGIIFGIGLSIARMTDPEKIWDFLDFAAIPSGGWDPSLAFVMGGGVLVGLVGLRIDRWLRMPQPVAAPLFIRTTLTQVDAPLVLGAAVFGVGWGISGFCPGPSVANLGLVPGSVIPFVAAMLAGSWIAGQITEGSHVTPATRGNEEPA
jgi:uncharacterized membrane protein YedE/YeeE